MASTYLTRTISSEGNRTTLTISCWFKRSKLGADHHLFSSRDTGVASGSVDEVKITSGNNLRVEGYSGSGYNYRKITNRVLRDTNAWYHVVVAYDTSNSTADDRIKIYINGERETSFSTSTNPSSSFSTYWFDTTDPFVIGTDVRTLTGASNFDGLISHIHVADGTAYDADTFGETDSTTGQWKIKTSPSVTYGTNGFFLFKDDNSVNDQSGNGNNFTASGTLTQTEDNPSNVFATQNPLQYISAGCNLSFEHGNTTVSNACAVGNVSTLGVSSGKYYWEGKLISFTNGGGTPTVNNYQIGVIGTIFGTNVQFAGSSNADGYSYLGTGKKSNNGTESTYGDTYGVNDIIGVALDLDNNKLYFSKNGTWQNSGDPTSGATGTGAAFTLTDPSSTTAGFYFNCCGHKDNLAKWSMNFGSGYFGTTAITSEGTNASGLGKFEYDVPTGYTALCTKGLNE